MSMFKKKPKNPVEVTNLDKNALNKQQKSPSKEKKLTKSAFTRDFIDASKAFENTRIDEIEKSRTIAWRVAAASLLTTIFMSIAMVFLTPLKEVEPYLVRVDNNTGQTDIVTVLANAQSDYGEEVAKFFSANYVRLVEGYDWYTVQSSFNKALLFSDSDVQNRLNNKFASTQAPHKLYKDKQRVEIEIDNVTFIDENLMQVRFTKKVVPVNGGVYNAQEDTLQPLPIESQAIATIGFDYINVPNVDEVRLVNPLGFVVKSYRVDEVINQRERDIVAAPAPALVAPLANETQQPTVENF
ncbi:MAG: virB8 family protein [Proteus vulgaris]